jgi:hypothetical protein
LNYLECPEYQVIPYTFRASPDDTPSSRSEVSYDNFAFVHQATDVIRPPLKHLLPLLCILGNDIHITDALEGVEQDSAKARADQAG